MRAAKLSALAWSLAVHAVIAAGFLVTLRFTVPVQQQPAGEVIEAVAIDAEALRAREHEKAEAARRAEEARQAELRRQREAAERAAAEQREREEQARQAELRKQEESRRQKEAEAKRVAEEARRKAEAERQRKAEAEAKRKAEAERKQREAEAAAREQRESELMRSLEAEEQRLAAIRSGKLAQYQALIVDKVMRYWLPPPNLPETYYCDVTIRQIPGGEVVSVKAGKCDNDVLARSAETAVWKASPLPAPPDPSLFDQHVRVEFVPPED